VAGNERGSSTRQCLGSLLFLIYVNDLPSQVTGGLLLQYADDTTLICPGPSNSDVAVIMNHQLELISEWTLTNKMRINHSKSSVMWFKVSNHHQSPDLPATLVEGVPLSVASKQRYLGLIFDDQLK